MILMHQLQPEASGCGGTTIPRCSSRRQSRLYTVWRSVYVRPYSGRLSESGLVYLRQPGSNYRATSRRQRCSSVLIRMAPHRGCTLPRLRDLNPRANMMRHDTGPCER